MRIRNLLLACIGLVSFVAVLGAGSRAIEGFVDRARLVAAMHAATGLRLSMVLSERISSERSKMSTLLGIAPPGQADPLRALGDARDAVDVAVQAALPYAGAVAGPLTQSIAELERAHDQATNGRAGFAPAEITRLDRQFVLAAAASQRVIASMIEENERTLNRFAPRYSQFVVLATFSQALREIAGLRSALLSPSLARNQLSGPELRELDELSGQIRSAWNRIQLSFSQIAKPPAEMLQAYQVMSTTVMGEGDRRYRTLITALGEGRTPDMTIAQYRAWTSPMLANSLLLRNTVLQELAVRFAVEQRQKAWQVALAITGILVTVALAGGALWLIMRRVVLPLGRLTDIVGQLAEGELAVEIAGYARDDELGSLAQAVLVLRDRAIAARRLQAAVHAEEAIKLRAAAILRSAALTFEHASASELLLVHDGETTLRQAVHSLDLASRRTVEQTHAAAVDVVAAATKVEVLAGAVAAVEATVNDVSISMAHAAAAVSGAESGAGTALVHILELADVASRISRVVHVIQDIAERTKLLALNAALEASRAGLAGKGFAVVAAEVKSLAVQTAQATGEVATHIGAIQHATSQASDMIRRLSAQVATISLAASSVVVAIEQQRAATDDIAVAARTASAGALNAATQVQLAAKRTEEAQVLALTLPTLAEDIKNATGSLRSEIECFVNTVREAA